MSDRILTTHGGSLIRPDELMRYVAARHRDEPYDEDAYQECLRRSVTEVVRQQRDVGVSIVSDGEFGKSMTWSRYIRDRLGGFEEIPWGPEGPQADRSRGGNDRRRFADFYAEYEQEINTDEVRRPAQGRWVCTGPIHYTGHEELQRDIANLKAAIAEVGGIEDGFLPVVAPASAAPLRSDQYYGSEEEFIFALADAMNEEYRAIVDGGFLVQIDDAFLATMYDSMVPPGTMREYREWAELRIEATKRALRGIPEERSRYHVCWGSWNGPHSNDVPLREIVDLILSVPVGHYALEGANPRHEHEWQVWKDVELPGSRKLIPGVVSHATNIVEHPELVAERVVRLARILGPERVIAGTDCGFAQSPGLKRVHPSIVWAKLEALGQGAELATQQLRRAPVATG